MIGVMRHHANEFQSYDTQCFKYGKPSHKVADKSNGITYYNYGEQGRISTNYQKPEKVQYERKVFALFSLETTSEDILINGMCFINNIPLIAIIDTGATHLFSFQVCAKRLNLKLSSMYGSMVIDTPTLGPVLMLWVCLNCLLTIYGKNFGMYILYLPLRKLYVILGMNQFEFNHVYINCFDKIVSFPKIVREKDIFVSAMQVDESVKDGAMVFMVLA